MQPKLTVPAVLSALQEFDNDLRDSKQWAGWEDNAAHKYALVHDGKKYPVKKIASLASGVPVGEFSGGRHPAHTNALFEDLDFKVRELRPANPDWTTDELIVALDFYLRHKGNPPGQSSEEIAELSALLRRLGKRVFPSLEQSVTFRNANGTYMKLMNFRRLDPQFTSQGQKGLGRGSAGEEQIWRDYASDSKKCAIVAQAIIQSADSNDSGLTEEGIDETEEAVEGRLLTRKHVARERNSKLVAKKKRQALKRHKKLECEICGFDFFNRYGERGKEFIECHHTKPLSMLTEVRSTHLNDLALLCANCHRMIHRGRPWLALEELKLIVKKTSA